MEPSRIQVMKDLEPTINQLTEEYLESVETNWQPSDYLPDFSSHDFVKVVQELKEQAKELSDELLTVLVGNMLTEEALPTYESWLFPVEGVNYLKRDGWSAWVRGWTAEENRHGDILRDYLYLSGRVDMRQMAISLQYLLKDGFDIKTGNDPFKVFIYTSFQEWATNVSHRRVAQLAKKAGATMLARICGVVASDEVRHAKAYQTMVKKIMEADPNGMLHAFEAMMRNKIVMPAHFLREMKQSLGETYTQFSSVAQNIGVYTPEDYTNILEKLIDSWGVEKLTGLNEAGEKARDYVCELPNRLRRVAERVRPSKVEHRFSWIKAA